MQNNYVIGVDFGTDSARAILVNAGNGQIITSGISFFKRWGKGLYCDPSENRFRQHPLDYVEALEEAVGTCLKKLQDDLKKKVRGISIATTGSSPVAVDKQGRPLALSDPFKRNPDAMFFLWKDHTSINEAGEINQVGKSFSGDYLKYVGGTYSPEWYWAKLLYILRNDSEVAAHTFSFVEQSDWLPFLLTGGSRIEELKRNVCAAGHKALWAEEYGGLPTLDFFRAVDPLLEPYVSRFGNKVYAADKVAGNLSKKWAKRWGLSENVKVGIGAIDAHVGAVGGNIKPYYMSKVIGTSTCDMMVIPKPDMKSKVIKGISGQVHDSIIPGMVGLEAGQSAFGDIYSWLKNTLLWPREIKDLKNESEQVHLYEELDTVLLETLNREAASLPREVDAELALDWFNGRRTPNVNPKLRGLITNLGLGSTPPRIFRALVEATCFGSRAIIESIENQELEIKGIIAIGGIAEKSKYVIQTLADIINRPIQILSTGGSVAFGAAMFAAVSCELYLNIEEAGKMMIKDEGVIILPHPENIEFYNKRYITYKKYGEFVENARDSQ